MDEYTRRLHEIISEQSDRIKQLEFLLPKKVKPKKFSASKKLKLKRLSKLEEDFFLNKLQPNVPKIKKVVRNVKKIKRVVYKKHSTLTKPNFWVINPSNNLIEINRLVKHERLKLEDSKKLAKYITTQYFNIKSHEDIEKILLNIYNQESNEFKIHISFGYVTENIITGNRYIYYPSNKYFSDTPYLVKSRKSIDNLSKLLNAQEISDNVSQTFPESGIILSGVWGMNTKIFRLDYPVGSEISLPDYIKSSTHIVSLQDCPNNLCAFACFALMHPKIRRDRYILKAKELFSKFYNLDKNESTRKLETYLGFDYINELDRFEQQSEFSINIMEYSEDKSVKYIRRSKFNDIRPRKYINLYKNHFSYITCILKLMCQYVCEKCNYRFRDNSDLDRHYAICTSNTTDIFNTESEIWIKPENVIDEISQHFELNIDFKYDYIVTYDLESLLIKINEQKENTELKFTSKHTPVSIAIATNIPGFSTTFIWNQDQKQLILDTFTLFDKLSKESKNLMLNKMQPLLDKINIHYDEDQKQKYLDQVETYCSSLPIVGFNSSFYDINLMMNEGFMNEIIKRDQNIHVVKDGNRYKQVKTKDFNFLDQMLYCAAGTSLESFIETYTKGMSKFIFPYEFLDSFEKLKYLISELQIEHFNSSLRNTNISVPEFNDFLFVCDENKIITMLDLLEYYNKRDVEPFLYACLKQKEFYYSFKLDMYKDSMGLPGLSSKILNKFMLKDYDTLTLNNNILNTIFNSDINKKILSYKDQDIKANRSLDRYITCDEVRDLLVEYQYACHYCWNPVKFGSNPCGWSLDRINCAESHTKTNCLISCINCNRERSNQLYKKFYKMKAIKRYESRYPLIRIVDNIKKIVFDKLKSNICGGASIIYHRYHEKDKTEITRVHYNIQDKTFYHDKKGQSVQNITGFDANALYLYCLGQDMPCGKLEWEETNDLSIINNEFYGYLEVDIEVPEEKYEYFCEVCPLFQNVEIDESVCGEFTTNLITKIKGKFTKCRKLIAALKVTKVLILSSSLQWLIDHGCIVTRLYGVIKAIPRKIFSGFVDWVSDERRKGDSREINEIIADTAKIVGNSAFGQTIMNKNKHKKIKYCNEVAFNKSKNKTTFIDAVEFNGLYEVSLSKKRILQNMPLQIGCTVFNVSKTRILEFAYDCVDKYIDRSNYQYMEMDTDSAYIALTGEFDDLIKPEMRSEYELDKNSWFPRINSKENAAYDKRKPGLFKVEFKGSGMVALCSKSYYVWGDKTNKFSCKGTQHRNNHLTKEIYLNVLNNSERLNVQNRGFRYSEKSMKTYEQNKIGLTPIYTKGVLFEDGVHIHPIVI